MQIYYLEIVTQDVESTCQTFAKVHAVHFGEPDPALGNARTAKLPGGIILGIRAPMHESEAPVIRPYWLVNDVSAALDAAVRFGAVVAHPPMEIPGHGTFAIYFHGGTQHGLWQCS